MRARRLFVLVAAGFVMSGVSPAGVLAQQLPPPTTTSPCDPGPCAPPGPCPPVCGPTPVGGPSDGPNGTTPPRISLPTPGTGSLAPAPPRQRSVVATRKKQKTSPGRLGLAATVVLALTAGTIGLAGKRRAVKPRARRAR